MPLWCSTDSVIANLKGIQGANFDPSDIEVKIEEARATLIAQFSGKFATTLLNEWDAAGQAPPEIAAICSKMAAALILEAFGDGQSTADTSTKAGGWYANCQLRIKGIVGNKAYVATSSSDNTAVTRTDALITTNKTASDIVFNDTDMEHFQ